MKRRNAHFRPQCKSSGDIDGSAFSYKTHKQTTKQTQIYIPRRLVGPPCYTTHGPLSLPYLSRLANRRQVLKIVSEDDIFSPQPLALIFFSFFLEPPPKKNITAPARTICRCRCPHTREWAVEAKTHNGRRGWRWNKKQRLQTLPVTQKHKVHFTGLPRVSIPFLTTGRNPHPFRSARMSPASKFRRASPPHTYMLTLLIPISTPPAERRRLRGRGALRRHAVTARRSLRRCAPIPTCTLRCQLWRAPCPRRRLVVHALLRGRGRHTRRLLPTSRRRLLAELAAGRARCIFAHALVRVWKWGGRRGRGKDILGGWGGQ